MRYTIVSVHDNGQHSIDTAHDWSELVHAICNRAANTHGSSIVCHVVIDEHGNSATTDGGTVYGRSSDDRFRFRIWRQLDGPKTNTD